MSTENRPKAFEIEEINTASNELVISLGKNFCPAVAAALIAVGVDTNNIALCCIGWFIRDGGLVLNGIPIDRFPKLAEKNVLTNEVEQGS